jgi:hypothetical protein
VHSRIVRTLCSFLSLSRGAARKRIETLAPREISIGAKPRPAERNKTGACT